MPTRTRFFITVAIAMVSLAGPRLADAEELPAGPPDRGLESPGLVAGGVVTTVVATPAIAFGGLILALQGAAHDPSCAEPPCSVGEAESGTTALGVVLLAGGVAMMGGGVTMIVVGSQAEGPEPTARVRLGPGGAALFASF